MKERRIGFVGAGQMARALARGFVQAERVAAERITACDVLPAALSQFQGEVPGCRAAEDGAAVTRASDTVFLAVKPQHMAAACQSLGATAATSKTLFVSIAAGVPLARLTSLLGTERVVRVMPNTPCLVAQGASAYCGAAGVDASDRELVDWLLSAVGLAIPLDEHALDAVTGLSGSGPAFVYQFLEALADGGVAVGLPRGVAQQLAAQTVLGAAAMVQQTGEHPAVLKDRVASPAGTTIAGLQALEQGRLRATVMDAVVAATQRSRELGRS